MADAPTKKPSGLSSLNIPVLEGWVLIAEAAEMLGVTRQHAYRLVKEKELENVRRLGTSEFYVVPITEVQKRLDTLAERKAKREVATE